MVSLPRSVQLAAWCSLWLRGQGTVEDVVARVRGSDEPHHVDGPAFTRCGSPAPLAAALESLRDAGAHALAAALPRPGDPQGLAGPPALNEAAIEAGEAVLAYGSNHALVPRITTFGPPGDEGHFVEWAFYDAEPPPPAPSVASAERDLTEALLQASDALDALDIAAWRPEVAQLLDDVRSGRVAAPLPHGFPAPAQSLAARAARLWAVAEFALSDDGAARTASSAAARREALRPLEREARHALAVAASALTIDNG